MRRYKISGMALVGMFSLQLPAQTWKFDAAQFGSNISDADIDLFNQGGQLPGTYLVDVLLNGEPVDSRKVVFQQQKNQQGELTLQPCLTRNQLSRYGIKTEDYPALMTGDNTCADLRVIPQASAHFNFSGQQLELSVPQVALRQTLKGIAPQELWDEGVPALLMNYRTSYNRMGLRQDTRDVHESLYLNLEPGANMGPWRLRNATTWQQDRGQSGVWKTPYTYIERGLYPVHSRLTLGERFTSSDVFNSVPFRGVMLASDENMRPSSQRAFSPVVRGIARTQATVEVTQNGYTIYSASVAPGPFALTDLSVGYGGDLQVTVREADGSIQTFTVSYQTPAVALPQGHMLYGLMAGQYRSSAGNASDIPVSQATVMYGLPWDLTLYGGIQEATHYRAIAAGMGISLNSWGAVSFDGTYTSGQEKNQPRAEGGYGRLRYSKNLAATQTTFSFSTTHYTPGYLSLPEVMDSYARGTADYQWYPRRDVRQKTGTTLSLNQSLDTLGSLSLSGTHNTYSNGHGDSTAFSASYSVGIRNISLTLNVTQNRHRHDGQWRNERLVNVMTSIPLDSLLGSSTRVNYQMTSPSSGGNTQQIGLNGQAFHRQLQWNINQRVRSGNVGDRHSNDLRLGWSGSYGQVNGSYSYSSSWQQMGLDAAGGIVLTGDGLTAGQPLNDTVALVEAPGASGVSVGGWPGVKTDFRGYTTLSGLQPYRKNTVSLDPTQLPDDAELKQTDVTVIPTQGAVIPASFVTHVGGRALITLKRPDGHPVPFGALVTPDKQKSAGNGISGENGQTYLSGLDKEGVILVRWGETQQQQCRANYRLPKKTSTAGLYLLTTVCH